VEQWNSVLDVMDARALAARDAQRNSFLAYGSAIVALTGVQLIAPTLPSMRDTLGLTDAELGLVMSVYLLPAALAAIPLGIAADRFGRRIVLGATMVGFGVSGGLLQLVDAFPLFLTIRFLQGVMFAGLLPLTMTVLGDAFTGADLIRAQGRRSVAMSIGDGVLPVIGGILVAFGWFVPWLGQLVAIPLGVAILTKLVNVPSSRSGGRRSIGFLTVVRLFRSGSILALQYAGFLRMFLKFCLLTFLPVLLVDERGISAAFAGLVLGAAALGGTAIAASAGRISTRGRPTVFVAVGIGCMAVAITVLALAPWRPILLGAALLYGAGDGLMGVFTNSFVTSATGAESRASFVAVTGAIRNFAKFTAPAAFGVVVLALPITTTFLITAGIALISVLVAYPLRHLEQSLTGHHVATT
jgi:MFS family permease